MCEGYLPFIHLFTQGKAEHDWCKEDEQMQQGTELSTYIYKVLIRSFSPKFGLTMQQKWNLIQLGNKAVIEQAWVQDGGILAKFLQFIDQDAVSETYF